MLLEAESTFLVLNTTKSCFTNVSAKIEYVSQVASIWYVIYVKICVLKLSIFVWQLGSWRFNSWWERRHFLQHQFGAKRQEIRVEEQHICSNWACSDPSHDIISSYYNENTFQISTEYWLIWYRMARLPSIFHIKRKFFLKGGIFPSTPDK